MAVRERKEELRALSRSALQPDISVMRPDDLASDCQSHTGALDLAPILQTAVEFVENLGLLLLRDSGSFVTHACYQSLLANFGSDNDRRGRKRILQRIVDQISNRHLDEFGVDKDQWQIISDQNLDFSVFDQRLHLSKSRRN